MSGATSMDPTKGKTAAAGRRVLLTVDTVGGVWTYGIDLARALTSEGASVVLAAIGPEISDDQKGEAASVPGLTLEFHAARLEWMLDPWDDVEATRKWLLELERRHETDVIHLNQYCYTAAGFQAPTLVVGHSCVYSWFAAVKGSDPGEGWERYRTAVSEGLAAATGVTAISESMLDELSRWYGAFRRLPAVRNGRALGGIQPHEKAPFVFSAGRVWDEAKNLSLLDSIADQLEWPIRVAGNPEPPSGTGYETTERLELLGQLDKDSMAVMFGEASIYAAPAYYEPFGLAILEAASAGCALVLSDIPSLRALWEGAAIFVSPRSPQCWVNALKQLIDDEPMRLHLGDLAQQQARSVVFSPARMARGYLDTYAALAPAAVALHSS